MKKILFTSLLSLGALAAGGSNAQIVFQAEDYNNMNGVQAENTSDAGGGRNLGYLNSGDWATYNKVTLPCAGTYKVEYRVASVSNTGVLILDRAGEQENFFTLDLGEKQENFFTLDFCALQQRALYPPWDPP